MPLSPDAVGRRYSSDPIEITKDLVDAYADATEFDLASDTDLAPPLFAVRPMVGVLFDAIEDPEVGIDLVRLVHGEQDMVFDDAIRVGDRLDPSAEITRVAQKSSGEVLDLVQKLHRDGELVAQATSTLFVRASKSDDANDSPEEKAPKPKSVKLAPEVPEDVEYEESEVVDEDQSVRYAQASGDMNPLHTDPEFAKKAGLPNVILHGLCTMAIASRAVIRGAADGDLTRLHRFKVRFAAPVFPGDTLVTSVWRDGEEDLGDTEHVHVMTRTQDGRAVLTRAEAWIDKA